ncbi:transcriptional regulator [Streptomyces sp. F001]|uniref:winged helix-turn-helix transcriptional regulator n=1 Tax=Streptomyces sp. F001 TaxID=1510026 RepID=UPI00101E2F71|nr:helix-turn-helix domain-containing protein [Streptomyces sp. F001]RZB19492.1 transcriptional regulator [Streptomyces sp. F001]
MKRRELGRSPCPIDRSLHEVGDAWTFQILRDAMHGVTRFTDFSKSIGLATNILTARLQKLVAVGIFEIHESDLGNSHEYVLTEKGRDFHTVLAAMRQWGLKHLFDDDEPVHRVIDARTGRQPRPLTLTAEDGRELSPEDILLVRSRAADPIETALPVDTPRRRAARPGRPRPRQHSAVQD